MHKSSSLTNVIAMMLNLDLHEDEEKKGEGVTKYGSLQVFADSNDIAENFSDDLFTDEYPYFPKFLPL